MNVVSEKSDRSDTVVKGGAMLHKKINLTVFALEKESFKSK